MSETANLGLPLLDPGQAGKAFTMNEALTRIDTLLLLSVKSWTVSAPPVSPEEGDRYIVAPGASGDWLGQDSALAVRVNGGWDFSPPLPGWRAFVEDEGGEIVFSSGVWTLLVPPPEPSETIALLEFDHVLTPGGAQTTAGVIPAGAILFGVSARVLDLVTGVTGWSMGVEEAETRYGSGLPVTAGAPATGATGAPLAYLQSLPLKISPEGGSFSGGRIRFRLHFLLLEAPSA
ncbi:MAG: DUF2793 domain-containing protein [Pseudomonadota bacterium]